MALRLKGAVVEMYRMKIMLVGLLAMLALGAVASATASAALPQGPWFYHREGTGQAKWGQNKEQPIESKNQGSFTLRGKVLGISVVIKCETVENTGFIWNGQHQGQDEAEVKFTKCFIVNPCAGTEVTVSSTKVYTELQWKYGGKQEELKEVGQQKIYDVFAPTTEPTQKELGEKGKGEFAPRARFVTIEIPVGCAVAGKFEVEAAGSLAIFEDQHQGLHKIIWGTAAETNPQNQDSKEPTLQWKFPNPTLFHHQETQTKAQLLFGGSPAELEGVIHIKRTNGEEFGAFNE
jgi:hypothetical protein